ncbi:hypothetical protein K8R04_02875 [Candidatus Uhrbacteria bacterium]|nr:hypothetical protein [Candidatus Uhrbacteria bacterium]
MSMSIDVNTSYLAIIRDSIGSRMFRHLYAIAEDGTRKEILQNGRLACAYYVAFILYHFQLVASPHATVESTVKDMEEHGWSVVDTPEVGDVLVWEASVEHVEDESHTHIGFYVGDERAVSNQSSTGEIVEHDWTFGVDNEGEPNRKVTKILRYNFVIARSPTTKQS